MLNFQAEVMASEARAFYAIQNAIEVIHGEQYFNFIYAHENSYLSVEQIN